MHGGRVRQRYVHDDPVLKLLGNVIDEFVSQRLFALHGVSSLVSRLQFVG